MEPDDTVVDLGCGKGRVVCCAARFKIKKAVGIEINPRHVRTAFQNSRRLRGRKAEIQIIEGLAQEADLSGATVFYLFNPFGSSTLREVLAKIEACIVLAARPIRIAYVTPECGEVLDGSGWLERYAFWEPRPRIGLDYPVAFWRSTDSREADVFTKFSGSRRAPT